MTDTTTGDPAAVTDELVDEPEVHTPEVVRPEPGTDVEQAPAQSGAHAAIERAAEAALAMPGMPGRDEFLMLAMQARILSMSGAAPKAIRDNPHVAFHVAMVGRDLGISPSAACELIDVIEGSKRSTTSGTPDYRLSLSPQLLNGQIRRLGLGMIVPWLRTEHDCIAMAVGPGGADRRCMRSAPDHHPDCECDVLGYSEFSWDDARMAGLVGQGCEPGQHATTTKRRNDGSTYEVCGCNQGYRTYPKRMLWWRAGGFAGDDYFPEAGLGLYSPEELGAIVDDEGRLIDPATVALPDGYEPPELPPPPPPPPPADTDALWDLQLRIRALPDEQRTKLAERWKDSGKLTYEHEGSRRPYRPTELPAASVSSADSMVTGFERLAARGDWDPDAARARVVEQLAQVAFLPLVAVYQEGTSEPTAPPDAPEQPASTEDGQDTASGHTASDDDPPAERPPDRVEAIIDHVAAMGREALVRELKAAGLGKSTELDDMRRTLGQHLLASDWQPPEQPPAE